MEIAQLLYDYGGLTEPTDVYVAMASRETEWVDWMLAHGADPDGETVAMVDLDSDDSIHFYDLLSAPSKDKKQKLIVSQYMITSWNPSPENWDNFELLAIKYKASLSPLSQD